MLFHCLIQRYACLLIFKDGSQCCKLLKVRPSSKRHTERGRWTQNQGHELALQQTPAGILVDTELSEMGSHICHTQTRFLALATD